MRYSVAIIVQEGFSELAIKDKFRPLFEHLEVTSRVRMSFKDNNLYIALPRGEGDPVKSLRLVLDRNEGEGIFAFHAFFSEEEGKLDSLKRTIFRLGNRYIRFADPCDASAERFDEITPWFPFLVWMEWVDQKDVGDNLLGEVKPAKSGTDGISELFIDPIFLILDEKNKGDLQLILEEAELHDRVLVLPPRPIPDSKGLTRNGFIDPYGSSALAIRRGLVRNGNGSQNEEPAGLTLLRISLHPFMNDLLQTGAGLWFQDRTRGRSIQVEYSRENNGVVPDYLLNFMRGEKKFARPWCWKIVSAMLGEIHQWEGDGFIEWMPVDKKPLPENNWINVEKEFGRLRHPVLEILEKRNQDKEWTKQDRLQLDKKALESIGTECRKWWKSIMPATFALFNDLTSTRDLEELALLAGRTRNDDEERWCRASRGLAYLLFWPAFSRFYSQERRYLIGFEGVTSESFFGGLKTMIDNHGDHDADGDFSFLSRIVEGFFKKSLLVGVAVDPENNETDDPDHNSIVEWVLSSGKLENPPGTEELNSEISGEVSTFLAVPTTANWKRTLAFLHLLLPLNVRIVKAFLAAASEEEENSMESDILGLPQTGPGYLVPVEKSG